MRSAQIAIVHCNAQTSPQHVIQKLGQTCMVISTNTGRVYRPKDSERLVLYLKDINLPKPDKWGTSQLTAFLQQVMLCNLLFVVNFYNYLLAIYLVLPSRYVLKLIEIMFYSAIV